MHGKRNRVWVGGEQRSVVNLARHPPLHETHVLVGRELHRLVVFVEPGIGVIPISACVHALAKSNHSTLPSGDSDRLLEAVLKLTCQQTSWGMSWDCKCWCHLLPCREQR